MSEGVVGKNSVATSENTLYEAKNKEKRSSKLEEIPEKAKEN